MIDLATSDAVLHYAGTLLITFFIISNHQKNSCVFLGYSKNFKYVYFNQNDHLFFTINFPSLNKSILYVQIVFELREKFYKSVLREKKKSF